MTETIFPEGGPHHIENMGDGQIRMSITIPPDPDGRIARQCPLPVCSPGYFKVKPGTGIIGQTTAYCPYCRHSNTVAEFKTEEQERYKKDIVLDEATKGIDAMFQNALGLGASGRRTFGSGLVSMEMTYKSSIRPPVRRPVEDEVRRDVICPHCALDQTVFGLATWCADCGKDIFLSHVDSELRIVGLMADDIPRRETSLGKRVAAKDLENCLEDAVSIFEASIKVLVRRALLVKGYSAERVEVEFRAIGNAFQNIARTKTTLTSLFRLDLGGDDIWQPLDLAFEKRHPVTHNLGVIDQKYLRRVKEAEREGRELRISEGEIRALLNHVREAIASVHNSIPLDRQPTGYKV